jgi:hypothetical protein
MDPTGSIYVPRRYRRDVEAAKSIEDREPKIAAERMRVPQEKTPEIQDRELKIAQERSRPKSGDDTVDAEYKLQKEQEEAARLKKQEEDAAKGGSGDVPLPPRRPSDLDSSDVSDTPLPPPRPADLGGVDPSQGNVAAPDAGGALGGLGGLFGGMGGMGSWLGPLLGIGSMAAGMLLSNHKKKKRKPSFGMSGPVQWGILHEGGLASDDVPMRSVSSVSAAIRMHTGGIAGGGLGPSEVPRILDKHEEVLTRNDPRHILNGGGKGGGAPQPAVKSLKIVNAFDPGTVLQHALDTPHGEQAIMNHVRANSDAYKGIIG